MAEDEQRFAISIQRTGRDPILTHTDFRHAAMLRFCRAVMASGPLTTVTVTDGDQIVASATIPDRSHRVTGNPPQGEPTNE